MLRLTKTLQAWPTQDFNIALKRELESVPGNLLPLHQAMTQGSYVLDEPHSISVLTAEEASECIRVKIGVFFNSIIAGCNCADDPSPVDALNEYCEMWLEIDKRSGDAKARLAN